MSVQEAHRTAVAAQAGKPLSVVRALHELGLRRSEFDLAVLLGHVRTTVDADGSHRRIAREEVDRLQAADRNQETLRERVRTVGTTDAQLMDISPVRFGKPARAGYITPVQFYLNRYRAVVWLYLAEELQEFATRQPGLLTGRTPPKMRAVLDAGEDRRARNWRSRRLSLLTRQTQDPWEQAAITSSVLDPFQLAEVVDDPYERAYLNKLRPGLVERHGESPAAREAMDRLLPADDPDEILWQRVSLALLLDEAREDRAAPGDRPAASSAPLRNVPGAARLAAPQEGVP
ncbi:hypothetical protein AR457_03925 [Streptomyces agglomeratus]|uniref:Uncharacterized protein n=1 Tax=Streptomyces agglomeratus TaxID=285458 RepID=A0A1E5P2N4_9ACTN|nr:DUF6397 family protein [Streptomyces agglomeratus]OEJ23769.1 hypothetical protein AS594_04030 [Streptomyces agglomeratus]OEJ43364.1 hypothetical protein AR457_03925 [Streptomyces agglomeratus]OEJ54717.1 hypothetical protein BGK72_31845 [Streptomyces agglomeratus]